MIKPLGVYQAVFVYNDLFCIASGGGRIERYERGEREMPLWAAIKLADYYNVTLDYLVGRTDEK